MMARDDDQQGFPYWGPASIRAEIYSKGPQIRLPYSKEPVKSCRNGQFLREIPAYNTVFTQDAGVGGRIVRSKPGCYRGG